MSENRWTLDHVRKGRPKTANLTIQISGDPAPVSDPLPEGVERLSDGGLVARGKVLGALGDEWEWGIPGGWHLCSVKPQFSESGEVIYDVRPVRPTPPPEPRTEQVPLHKLAGRSFPGCDWVIGFYAHASDGWYATRDGFPPPTDPHRFDLDADGCVTVTYSDETDA